MTDERGYDLFVSYARPDRVQVRRLHRALEKAGLRVFLDEEDINPIEGITPTIENALRSSTALLAFYSASYTDRPACQLELTAAFLAGQREGDPTRRIIVVNPEEGTEHIQPAQLADPRFVVLPADDRGLGELVVLIRDRVRTLAGTLEEVTFTDRPRWFAGRVPGVVGFVGRYRDLWALHSALDVVSRPVTGEPTSGPVASVIGMPGIGKTALVSAYGWQFGAAYPGGVYWTSLVGASSSADAVLGRYAEEIRAVADIVGLRHGDASREQLFGALAEYLYRQRGPSLWIIDDVPDDLDPALVHRLIIPAGIQVRTVLVSHTDRYRSVATPVEVGSMTPRDAKVLLAGFRDPDPDEAVAFEQVVERLGGHPMTLGLVGDRLRDRQGIAGYTDYVRRLDTNADGLAVAADLLATAITGLPRPARLVVQLATTCGPAPLAARFVAAVVTQLAPLDGSDPGLAPDTAGAGLAHLRTRLLATRIDRMWHVHSLVLDAARRYLDPPVPAATLAQAAAAALEALSEDPELTPQEQLGLLRNAEVLATRADLAAGTVDTLLRRLAHHHEHRGEPILAAPYRTRLADRHLDSPEDQIAAAAALHAAGEFEAALDLASRVPDHSSGAGASASRLDRIRAEALDALSRFSEADPIWARLTAPTPPDMGPEEHLAIRVAHLRGLRLRGRIAEVKRLATELIAPTAATLSTPDPAVLDAVHAAQLELAHAEVITDGQRAARRRAAQVAAYYRDRGIPEHIRSLQAQEVLAEADLTLHLTELRPDKDARSRAVADLQQLRDDYLRKHGPASTFTLAAWLAYTQALVSQEKPKLARAELTNLMPHLAVRFGDRHPLYLRAAFFLGQTFAQRAEPDKARTLFEKAVSGQLAVLGPAHPHTLYTKLELAIALRATGDSARSAQLIREVRHEAPQVIGRMNEIYVRANLSEVFILRMPPVLVRRLLSWSAAMRKD